MTRKESLLKSCAGNTLTPLDQLVVLNRQEIIRLIIKDELIDMNGKTDDGRTHLFIALDWYNLDIAQSFVDHGANINETFQNKKTLLHLAIEDENQGMAKFLLRNRIDCSIRDCNERTALEIAIASSYFDGIAMLTHDYKEKDQLSN